MASDLVTIATTAILSQFLGPSAKHLGELALERGKQVGSKAIAMLANVGREPQPIEPKVLLPLVQAAALEADETLADKWASLLANAADPFNELEVLLVYSEMLRQLTPLQAQVLDSMFAQVSQNLTYPNPEYNEVAYKRSAATGYRLDLNTVFLKSVLNKQIAGMSSSHLF